jgi:hypothetical protein
MYLNLKGIFLGVLVLTSLFSAESRASAESSVIEDFNSYLRLVKSSQPVVSSMTLSEDEGDFSSSMAALMIEEDEKYEPTSKSFDVCGSASEVIRALWGIQRVVERLLEERHNFKTFKEVARSLKRFGDEISTPTFWEGMGRVYLNTSFVDYSGENHWQAWVRSYKGSFTIWKVDVLGWLLYPVRYTAMRCKDDWKYNPFVFYLQAHAATYGNSYARMEVICFLKGRSGDDRENGIDILNTSTSIAIRSPFNKDFVREQSDMNRLLWAAFADNHFKHGYYYVPREKLKEIFEVEEQVLSSIEIPTAESQYYLGLALLNSGKKDGAEKVLKISMERGCADAHRILSTRFSEQGFSIFTREKTSSSSIDTESIIMDTYREIFNIEI